MYLLKIFVYQVVVNNLYNICIRDVMVLEVT